jgi:hypothetical protein
MVLADSGPVVVNVELRASADAELIGSRVLRSLGFGTVLDEATAWMNEIGMNRILGDRWGKPPRRPGRGGRDRSFYAVWAARYVRASRSHPRSPVKQLVADEAAAGRHATEAQIRGYLGRARREPRLLTEAGVGRAGGDLTELGRRLAAHAGEEI